MHGPIRKNHFYIYLLLSILTVFSFSVSSAFAQDIIIDNLDAGLQGWQESGGSFEWAGSSYWARNGAQYVFTFVCPASGPYQVREWHSMYSSRSDHVLVTIQHDPPGSSTETYVNQKIGGQTWNPLGEFEFTQGNEYTVTITASDGSTVSTAADAMMFRPVTGNTPPVANDDSETTVLNTSVSINVLSNDADIDGDETIDETTVTIVVNPPNGSAVAEIDGTVIYTPNDGFTGTDTFSYTVKDDEGANSNPATVTVTVDPEADAVILDNRAAGQQGWGESSGEYEWEGSSYWARDGAEYVFTFISPTTGLYQLREWHSMWGSRSDNVLVTIVHDGGSPTQTYVNQQTGAQAWNPLGEFYFTQYGEYTITITSSPGPSSTCADAIMFRPVSGNPPPVAEFSGSPLSGDADLEVTFTDQSTGNPTGWSWDFGDGGSSTAQNPVHTYTAAGNYTVTLDMTAPGGTDNETKTDYISVGSPPPVPVAAFNGSPTSGNFPLAVTFTDQSTGNPTGWSWDFGDGGSSTVKNPVHTYTAAGNYTVTLDVTAPGGTDNETKTDYISVGSPPPVPVAAFNGSPTSGNFPLAVTFTDQSTGNPTGWSWDFGDGGSSTAQNPVHTYTAAGNYTVTLDVTAPGGTDTETKTDYISVTDSVQHVYAFPIFNVNYDFFRVPLLEIGATQESQEIWRYTNANGKEFIVHVSQDDVVPMIEALTSDSIVVMAGHANYGSGQLPSNVEDNTIGRVYGILTVDDPGLLKQTSPFFDGNTSGIRSHYDPAWQPIYQNGESAIMPFGFFDPSGERPPYNTEIVYKIDGDPTCYSSGVERMLPESNATPWFDSNCGEPDPTNPAHWQYFITTAIAYKIGNWATGAGTGDYGSNYYYTAPGAGDNKVIWEANTHNAGDYVLLGWWLSSSQNTTSATYTINQPDGSEIARFENVDQTSGGAWQEIGQFSISNPGPVGVFLTDAAGDSGNVIADAIQIVGPAEYANEVGANFRSSVRFGNAPLTVSFSRQHTGLNVTAYEWDLNGDGVVDSTSSSPSYTFMNPGSYDVTMTVRDANGNEDSSTFYGYIDVGGAPARVYAEFSNSSPTGNLETVPAEVSFTDRSVTSGGTIVSWQWDLDGDGDIDSTEQNPTFTYLTPGVYTVRLTAADNLGHSDTKIKEKYVLAMNYYNIIDNNASPSRHYSDRTILRRNGLPDIPADHLRYKKLYIHSCQGRYYLQPYAHGVVFYSLISMSGLQGQIWLKGVLQEKSDYELWRDMQNVNPIFDYYDFSKYPWEQP